MALRQVAEEVGTKRLVREVVGKREDRLMETAAPQAIGERLLALVKPRARSQRLVRRAWRSAQRLGAELDLLWVKPGQGDTDPEETEQLDALRRLARVLGAHLLIREFDDVVEGVKHVAEERGTTYVLLGSPQPRRGLKRFSEPLPTRLIEALPGIDVRIVADRALRENGES